MKIDNQTAIGLDIKVAKCKERISRAVDKITWEKAERRERQIPEVAGLSEEGSVVKHSQ